MLTYTQIKDLDKWVRLPNAIGQPENRVALPKYCRIRRSRKNLRFR